MHGWRRLPAVRRWSSPMRVARRELVTTPEAGRIVARNADAIAAGVREVLEANYAPEDVARTVERFSWEANAEALASYYRQLIS